MTLFCEREFEVWGPHEGCREFMDGPETWTCKKLATTLVIFTDRHMAWVWEKYGPFTQEEIDRSDGHVSNPIGQWVLCDDCAVEYLEGGDDQYTADIYIEEFTQEAPQEVEGLAVCDFCGVSDDHSHTLEEWGIVGPEDVRYGPN